MIPRVLVVEDDAVNQELVVALLEQEGCQVRIAETGDAALRLASAERPDLILMDVQLSGMTGYEATRRLKADPVTAAIPVVILTAQVLRGEEEKARAAGCDAYLSKPIVAEVFRQMLHRFLPAGRGRPGGPENRS